MATIKKVTLKDGTTRWRFRLYGGTDPDTGKPIIHRGTYDRKKDADQEVTRLKRMTDLGGALRPSKEPLGRYLKRFLKDVKKGTVRPRTYHGYRGTLRRYITDPPDGCPAVGKVRLHRLTPEALQSFYSWLTEEHGLAPRSIRQIHAVIRQGLAHAARTGALASNPATLVQLPKVESSREVQAMTEAEAGAFLEASPAAGPQYHALFSLLLSCGLRPGEALGLRWEDVDLEDARLRVHRSLTRRGVEPRACEACGAEHKWKLFPPKTPKGRRTVVLPAWAVEALRAHRVDQAERRLALGAEYRDHGFVFTTSSGEPLDHVNVSRKPFRRTMKRAGLGTVEEVREGRRVKKTVRRFKPRYTLYALRHTCATLLLRDGENPKVVSERLGHASVAFTMDVYTASLPDMQQGAADKMEARFGGGAG